MYEEVINLESFDIGNVVVGKITGIEKYGIFVNINEQYSGLIHISEVSDRFVSNLNNYGEIGDEIRVRIIGKEEETKHLRLSIKDLDYKIKAQKNPKIVETENGFNTLREKLPIWIEKKLKEIEENATK